ncbi:hypothetical protein OH799_33975 [Nocardia sp. NBC_00881]|uniref:hypothetical protein n=1 Tax=Nocardia sp. NBC_00881 TaxID=2975995 RepID=UPI0038687969|nr:hypothetical protein OH799_33975 [Nocardia sp. NBC_00881]
MTTTLEDLFLDVIEEAKHSETWEQAVDLHEHTKSLAGSLGRKQNLYSADMRRDLINLRNEALTKVRNALHRAKVDRDVTEHTAARQRWENERNDRLQHIDRELQAAEHEREAQNQQPSRPIPGHAFEGLTRSQPERNRDIGYER